MSQFSLFRGSLSGSYREVVSHDEDLASWIILRVKTRLTDLRNTKKIMLGKTWKCNCFYTHNIFIKEYSVHLVFTDEQQFFRDYSKPLRQRGCNTDEKFCRLLSSIKTEIKRRKALTNQFIEAKNEVSIHYHAMYPDLYTLHESFLDPRLKELHQVCKESVNADDLRHRCNSIASHRVIKHFYTFPVFAESFCHRFVSEIRHFQNTELPKIQPNTMNKYGVMLDQLGFCEFLNEFITNILMPITTLLYSDDGGSTIDSYKAFVVSYKTGEDIDLSYHYDNAEITLNVSLNTGFSGGNLYFGGMRYDRLEDTECCEVPHTFGSGILHMGQQMHGALPIVSGERFNLIIWLRSSSIRNQLCPMCDRQPHIVDLSENGDGFTDQMTRAVCDIV